MQTSIIGYPRVGTLRELKFATEKFFKQEISETQLQETGREIRRRQWQLQKASGLDFIPSNDFSFYDLMLDTAVLFNCIPKEYKKSGFTALDTYFAMARGYQGEKGDVKALAMKKWFNTNYHYIVPEVEDDTEISLTGTKPFTEYQEAAALGIQTKPVLIGPFTFLKLLRYKGRKNAAIAPSLGAAYAAAVQKLQSLGATWIQLDEPYLVHDITGYDLQLLKNVYAPIFAAKSTGKLLLQTYFGDIRDCYKDLLQLPFDGIGVDFIEGKETQHTVFSCAFPKDKVLFAGLLNGKNIWRNHYPKTLEILQKLQAAGIPVVLNTSCSLLHVPYTLQHETKLDDSYKAHFAFAEEKLTELAELKSLSALSDPTKEPAYIANAALFTNRHDCVDEAVRQRLSTIRDSDFTRQPAFAERAACQKKAFRLPLFPTTTIGSFPQTADVKAARTARRKGEWTEREYIDFNRKKIADCLRLQEELGLDVLVHGEFERNDMVEYFGEHLKGFLFTEKAWVQSYGTRCVKPPIIWGDVSRRQAITVPWSTYAQSLTEHPLKGMLTGPVTILNWSFPREDISLKESTYQIALAIRDEVLDLEKNGIRIIQIDEAALREKLPLRKSDWFREYLDWAIPAFRLVHSGVRPETQIHTHMCYSEFTDIIHAIDQMDADVITFEASRSDLQILDSLLENKFQTAVGPGVYDIHSPRVPSVEEIKTAVHKMLAKIPAEKLWINPDCGLKTRGLAETSASLKNMVQAAREIRREQDAEK